MPDEESPNMTPKALRLKIQILLSKGLLDDAVSLSESFRSKHPDCFDVNAALVDLYHQTAQFHLAEALIENLQPSSLEERQKYLRACGDCALAQYDLPRAESFYQRLLELPAAFSDKAKNLIRVVKVHMMKGDISTARHHAQTLDSSYLNPVPAWMRNFYALLLGEFSKFPELIEELRRIQHLPLSEQYDHLVAMIVAQEYGCPAGMTVLTAARRLSLWERVSPHRDSVPENQIPRNIVQFWDKAEVPADVAGAASSWKRHCAGFAYERFDDGSATEFIRRRSSPQTALAFKAARQPTMRSDIFRLAYLYERGGIYADADDLCRQDISPLLEDGYSLVLLQEDLGSIGNNFIAAAPRHPWLKQMLDELPTRVLERPNDTIWFATGPGALSHSFCKFYRDDLRRRSSPVGVRVRDTFYLSRFVSTHLPLQYKATNHWFL